MADIDLDADGCARSMVLHIGNPSLEVFFARGTFMEIFDSPADCAPTGGPLYFDDLEGAREVAAIIADALNGASPPIECVVQEGEPLENFQFVIGTGCMGDLAAGVFIDRTSGAWAIDERAGEAPFGTSSVYYFAVFPSF